MLFIINSFIRIHSCSFVVNSCCSKSYITYHRLANLTANIIRVVYPQNKAPSLENASLNISDGEVALITGATGSGKTTLLRCLNGVIPLVMDASLQGEICWNGVSLYNMKGDGKGNHPTRFTVLQNPFHSYIGSFQRRHSGKDNGREPEKWMMECMERSRSFQDLSAGERQRLILMQAFDSNPQLLLLDEPVSRLDEKGLDTFYQALLKRKRQRTGMTIIAEHRWESFENLMDCRVHLSSAEDDELQKITLEDGSSTAAVFNDASLNGAGKVFDFNRSNGQPLLKLKGVGMKINRRFLFEGVNLEIKRGEITGITGPNGSGKTTLGKVIVGRLKPHKGSVNGALDNMKKTTLFEDPQSQLLCDTVRDEVRFGGRNYDLPVEYTQALIEAFALTPLTEKSPFLLSHGQQERTAMAAVLANNPDLIVLDEPTQGQDYSGKERMTAVIRALKLAGKGVVVISHDLRFLRDISDVLLRLNGGKLERLD